MTMFLRASALALAIGCLSVPAIAEAARPAAKHTVTKKTVVKKKTVTKKRVASRTTRRTTVASRTVVRKKPPILPPNPVHYASAPVASGQTGTAADLVGYAGDPAVSQRGSSIANQSAAKSAAAVPAPAPAPRPTPRRF